MGNGAGSAPPEPDRTATPALPPGGGRPIFRVRPGPRCSAAGPGRTPLAGHGQARADTHRTPQAGQMRPDTGPLDANPPDTGSGDSADGPRVRAPRGRRPPAGRAPRVAWGATGPHESLGDAVPAGPSTRQRGQAARSGSATSGVVGRRGRRTGSGGAVGRRGQAAEPRSRQSSRATAPVLSRGELPFPHLGD
jgi:hypothetical protein